MHPANHQTSRQNQTSKNQSSQNQSSQNQSSQNQSSQHQSSQHQSSQIAPTTQTVDPPRLRRVPDSPPVVASEDAVDAVDAVDDASATHVDPATLQPTSGPKRATGLRHRLERLKARGVFSLFTGAEAVQPARWSSGVDVLDDVLHGGFPAGRLVELSGPPGIGKTTLACRALRACQETGGTAAIIDADHSLDRAVIQRSGVDGEHLVLARPDGGEAALHMVDELLRARAVDVIVVDSVASLVPRGELLGMTGTAPAGLHARLMSQAVRRLTLQAARARAVVIFVNQLRRSWGEDGRGYNVTTGGNALVYACATRVGLKRAGADVVATLHKARFGEEGRQVRLPE